MIEYFSENLWQMWTLVALACLIIELCGAEFVLVCFAVGAGVAALVSPFTNFYVQLAFFVVVSVLALFSLRPFVLRYIHKNDKHSVSNADALIGRVGVVKEPIEVGGYGRVAIDGDVWKSYSDEPDVIEVGARVIVIDRKSTIMKVERVS